MYHLQTKEMNRTITGVAGAIYGILQKHTQERPPEELVVSLSHPLHVFIRHSSDNSRPTFSSIYLYLYTLFRKAQIGLSSTLVVSPHSHRTSMPRPTPFTQECMIAAVMYLQQFLEKTGMPFTQASWERITFTCVMVASKSWDDISCSSHSFSLCSAGNFTLRELNKMERYLLRELDYQLYVTSHTYRDVYYELKEIWTNVELDSRSGNPLAKTSEIVSKFNIRPDFGVRYIFGVNEKAQRTQPEIGSGIGTLSSPYPNISERASRPMVRQTLKLERRGMNVSRFMP
ncbi:Cyclin, N-terminal domain [Carpediemonas membranifera]|uniref:Cyclin, N-terminal domain n=1 Tax=Carpediemonas membranifera TaxID=201153 RepID=A0A8J6BZL3_9EUKA|nr:Cyclin, N-terminal domain [Carpediemonas membranifera]|eukprot:KAG9395646.1 Cyclin, N-terminal domain [Carpediemonas membranifera]